MKLATLFLVLSLFFVSAFGQKQEQYPTSLALDGPGEES
jgi:hypothetical protein